MRASHADRDRIVDVLRVAAGDGRLTMEELDERLEVALSARTVGELAVLTTDLPEVVGETPVEAEDVVRIEQQGASTRRGEAWVVPRRLEIRSSFGEVTLDFTDAVITQDMLHIDLQMGGGALKLVTRPGVVVDTGSLALNYSKIKARRAGAGAEAPVVLRVRITGEISFGQVVVRRPRRGFGRRKPAG
ncbi:hypothetical protein GCM10010313_67400 [Streptomyces violarus]|uniref:DUF1707 domain-containing protein n=1 Tax=Streptomyces violarus TaxID=67380 RepID=A0A7W4ZZS1_9ACTN|nr:MULTISPECIES: DUF1707 domain-containing protein [Streptomyces]MBB3081366.1 hypothetical protein [Streptomyces violarus]WRU02617.1 DUF1707 domain-containing protein [Streptomyces sp. CGMCC 4.1772]GHD27581.1 hypothetical protein GCM10010313_67400 [Streptomyces violarus]